jgi:hypothetical protein
MQMNYKVIFVADGNATNTDPAHNATFNKHGATIRRRDDGLGATRISPIVLGRPRLEAANITDDRTLKPATRLRAV